MAAAPDTRKTFTGGITWMRVRVPRLLSRTAKVLYAFGAIVQLGALWDVYVLSSLGSLVALLAWPLFALSYILSLTQNVSPGTLVVVLDGGMTVVTGSSATTIAPAEIASALVVEREAFGAFVPTVEIDMVSGERLVARLADPTLAPALVASLGFGPGGRRVRAPLAKPTRRLLHPLLAAFAQGIALVITLLASKAVESTPAAYALPAAVMPLVALLVYELLKRGSEPTVTVGDDSVVVTGRRGTTRIPRTSITSVTHSPGGALAMEGPDLYVAVRGVALDDARLAAVARLVESGRSPAATTPERIRLYARRDRTLAAWREDLARAMTEPGYREMATTVDEAAAVLRSSEATEDERVGAALALRVAGVPPERIRVAAEALADDKVRVAVEAVADGDDDLALRALAGRRHAP